MCPPPPFTGEGKMPAQWKCFQFFFSTADTVFHNSDLLLTKFISINRRVPSSKMRALISLSRSTFKIVFTLKVLIFY